MTAAEGAVGMRLPRTALFAIASGAAVGNLYWAQPLLDDIARSLHVPTGIAGVLITVTQLSYAVGVLLLGPLGDMLDRRTLIPVLVTVTGLALILCSVAPVFGVLLLGLALLGASTISGQLLVALAGDLAEPARRGRTVGTVVSGILIGILLSRTVSGAVAALFGWRAIYVVAAVIAFVLAVLLRRAIPKLPARARTSYPALIRSLFVALRGSPLIPPTLLIGAALFSVFTMFWTALTFLLSAPPFGFSVGVIGLMGLVGVAGAVMAQRAGLLHDRGLTTPALVVGLACGVAAIVTSWLGARSIVAIIVAVLLLDLAVQGVNVLNQTRLMELAPSARSRINTAFVVCNFIGGAIGSALAGVLWNAGGWSAVMTGAGVLILIGAAGLSVVLVRGRRPNVPAA